MGELVGRDCYCLLFNSARRIQPVHSVVWEGELVGVCGQPTGIHGFQPEYASPCLCSGRVAVHNRASRLNSLGWSQPLIHSSPCHPPFSPDSYAECLQ